jgi:hypothetical protein
MRRRAPDSGLIARDQVACVMQVSAKGREAKHDTGNLCIRAGKSNATFREHDHVSNGPGPHFDRAHYLLPLLSPACRISFDFVAAMTPARSIRLLMAAHGRKDWKLHGLARILRGRRGIDVSGDDVRRQNANP